MGFITLCRRREMRSKIILAILTLMCLIGSISTVSASQETRLNIVFPGLLTAPSIYGNYVTWSDNHGNGALAYDLKTVKEIGIPSGWVSNNYKVPMYGNNIVWSGGDPYDIMVYNTAAKQTTTLAKGFSPAIYGNVVAYAGDQGINIYDLSTKKNTQINVSGTDPQIYGNYIVYADSGKVYIYNVSSRQQSLIGATSGQDIRGNIVLDIYGNVVVWANKGNIYMRNIATHKTTQITTNGISENPAIYDSRIVWNTAPGGRGEGNIYMYTNGKTIQITKSNRACSPAIYGNKIVYKDRRNNIYNNEREDLFVYDLTAKLAKPDATFEANITSGTHPLTVFFSYTENGDMPQSYLWNFGDGKTSTQAWTATHTYTKAGTYTVSLKVTNAVGSSTATKTIKIL
jgi:beta propeller repeat protein